MRKLFLVSAILVVATAACFGGGEKSDQDKIDDALERGLALQGANQIAEAEAAYNEVLAIEPSNAFALYNLGLIDQQAGRSESAENRYRLALSSNPDLISAVFNLAIVRADAGDYLEAIDLYRRVLTLDPNNVSGHLNLGYALRAIGQTAEGDAEIEIARATDASIPPPPPTETPEAPVETATPVE